MSHRYCTKGIEQFRREIGKLETAYIDDVLAERVGKNLDIKHPFNRAEYQGSVEHGGDLLKRYPDYLTPNEKKKLLKIMHPNDVLREERLNRNRDIEKEYLKAVKRAEQEERRREKRNEEYVKNYYNKIQKSYDDALELLNEIGVKNEHK